MDQSMEAFPVGKAITNLRDQTKQDTAETKVERVPQNGQLCEDCLGIGKHLAKTAREDHRAEYVWKRSEKEICEDCVCCVFLRHKLGIEIEGLRPGITGIIMSRTGGIGNGALQFKRELYNPWWFPDCFTGIYTAYDDPATSDPAVEFLRVPQCANSPACLQFVAEQLSSCETTHAECSQKTAPCLPDRVIAIKNSRLSTDPRLVLSRGTKGRYVALSHCWGPSIPTRLVERNLQDFVHGIPFSLLPQNFQDAINVTHKLGIEYLWIDALCIIQDSPSDWAKQAEQMSDIYHNASLTLIAASASSSEEGFLGDRTGRNSDGFSSTVRLPYPYQSDEATTQSGTIYLSDHQSVAHLGWEHIYQPTQSRAWCFQEWLLSTRCVSFNREQAIWQCKRGSVMECHVKRPYLDSSVLGPIHSTFSQQIDRFKSPGCDRQHFINSVLDYWEWNMEVYSRKQLTKASDVLPAISGIAHRITTLAGTSYLAGIWEERLLRQLQWKYRRYMSTSDPMVLPNARETCAPSWSWASRCFRNPKLELVFLITGRTGSGLTIEPGNHQARLLEVFSTTTPWQKYTARLVMRAWTRQAHYIYAGGVIHSSYEDPFTHVHGLVCDLADGRRSIVEGSLDIEYAEFWNRECTCAQIYQEHINNGTAKEICCRRVELLLLTLGVWDNEGRGLMLWKENQDEGDNYVRIGMYQYRPVEVPVWPDGFGHTPEIRNLYRLPGACNGRLTDGWSRDKIHHRS
ncbi:HET-domain-containing protein [Byssothecium circinans]|uniref:HET-domain-containing protein n=1 Tax=Byssothecium circinans TaxID=147558 RepID=A0A6A5TVW3_9PLEO|nr:HET-domain-containing protein [Byssothecium circinans]